MKFPKGKLLTLVVVFAAIGLVTATGAFTTVSAERTATVNVAGDSSALLALGPFDGPNGNGASQGSGGITDTGTSDSTGYAGIGSDGTLELNLAGYGSSAAGVNKEARTDIENVFVIQNQGSRDVNVTVDDVDLDGNGNPVGTEDTYVTFYYVDGNGIDVSLESDEGGQSVTLAPGDSVTVSVEINTIGATITQDNGESGEDLINDITISAEATN